MKKSLIFFVIVLLTFMSGCNDSNANSSKSEGDKQILENVWTYVKERICQRMKNGKTHG